MSSGTASGRFHTSSGATARRNLSFGAGFCEFTSQGFPVSGFPMVAPFWADVDTRAATNNDGVVWMKQGPNYLAVTYDHVGYYLTHPDLREHLPGDHQ